MSTIRINKRAIEAILNLDTGQVFYWDKHLTGFGVKATKTSKSYIVEGQVFRKHQRCLIGRVEILSLDLARKKAITILGDMANGIDPNEDKRERLINKLPVGAAYVQYIEMKTNLVDGTITGYRRACNYYLAGWANKPIAEITKQMVLSRHREISENSGKATANNTFRYFRAIYNFTAALSEKFPLNPVVILMQTRSWNKVTRRRTLVPAHLLSDWWKAVSLERETARDILLVALFTGMRRNKILTLN